jgi:hypothetical protein
MRITKHAQQRGRQRMGVDMRKFSRMLESRGLELPREGKVRTDMGTLVIKDGAVITVLSPEMATA